MNGPFALPTSVVKTIVTNPVIAGKQIESSLDGVHFFRGQLISNTAVVGSGAEAPNPDNNTSADTVDV